MISCDSHDKTHVVIVQAVLWILVAVLKCWLKRVAEIVGLILLGNGELALAQKRNSSQAGENGHIYPLWVFDVMLCDVKELPAL